MKTLILTFVPLAVFAGVFVISLIWYRRQPDTLKARYRLWSAGSCLLALAAVGMFIGGNVEGAFSYLFVLLLCEWERRRLRHQLQENERHHAA